MFGEVHESGSHSRRVSPGAHPTRGGSESWQDEPREVEGALIVRSGGNDVLSRIALLSRLGPYRVVPREPLHLRDRYLDTPNRDLGRQHLALRLREIGGKPYITLKGDIDRAKAVTERVEIEHHWSPDALRDVLQILVDRGVLGPELLARDSVTDASPDQAIEALGLLRVQDRETERRPFDLVSTDVRRAVAELALDSVTYSLTAGQARVHEIEVEAKAEDAAVAAVLEDLLRLVPELAPWKHNKLITGWGLQRGLTEGWLQLEDDGTVPSGALDELDERLSEEA